MTDHGVIYKIGCKVDTTSHENFRLTLTTHTDDSRLIRITRYHSRNLTTHALRSVTTHAIDSHVTNHASRLLISNLVEVCRTWSELSAVVTFCKLLDGRQTRFSRNKARRVSGQIVETGLGHVTSLLIPGIWDY